MDNIDVICPLYNASKYILKLDGMLKAQLNVKLNILYILTESEDNTLDLLNKINANYKIVKKVEFSHSLTREKAIFESNSDYLILLTQDIELVDVDTIYKLVEYTKENGLAGSYLKQKSIIGLDRYFREMSYGNKNYIFDKKDLNNKNETPVFFSDTFSCINVKIFKEINGYDNKKFETNEDMYYAYKCLINDLKIGYYKDKFVIHSHKLTIKSTYERYKLIGKFLYENKNIEKLIQNRIGYLKIVFLALKRFDIKSLFILPFNVSARVFGIRKGKKLARKEHKKCQKSQ